MKNKIKAKKLKMTQVWVDDKVVPVTVLGISNGDKDINELQEVKSVNIRGTSKGKGFQGVVKRHGFRGGPATHGQKHTLRTGGSIGPTDPQRVFPGRKMPGHMGGENITVKNLKVVELKQDEKKVLVKGAVPGMKGSDVEIMFKEKKEKDSKN